MSKSRCLSLDHNRTLKLSQTAATTARGRGPWKPWYEARLAHGLSRASTRLPLSRKLVAIAFALWKKGERLDASKLMSSAI